jgi:hypothetical protein
MHRALRKLLWVSVFAAAFGLVEAAVVVYLRSLYYPNGFSLPLHPVPPDHLAVELFREAATIVMLAAVAMAAGGRPWEKAGHFLAAFGVWDIFYYIWLFLFLRWPSSLLDWDVLFLIPVPWVAPVIAPVAVALLMVAMGSVMVVRMETGEYFHPRWQSWAAVGVGAGMILYSFMRHSGESLATSVPESYPYFLLVAGLALMGWGFLHACKRPRRG